MSIQPKKTLFVCLGNICRSPLAEAIFKKKINERALTHGWVADSCGTASYHIGHAPDPRTLRNAEKNGVTIEHVGRQLQDSDLEQFDYVFAMDESNLTNIFRLPSSEKFKDKVMLLRSFDSIGTNEAVPDPYYGSEKDFQQVFEILDRSIDNLIDHLTIS
jgi:protein-tyrosine phosphatase